MLIAFAGLFLVVIAARPLLPIDETRYMAVAWEMFVRQDWFAPLTLNFEPYYHKPPLLFWLINACWAIFGVSRLAATIPAIAASVAVVYLTTVLCNRLLPPARKHIVYVIVGSLPLTIYGSTIMFDTVLTAWVLGALVCLHEYARTGHKLTLVGLGLLLGCGVLTKGPVVYLYILFPVLFGPLWSADIMRNRNWYLGNLAAVAVSLVPILAWLLPMLTDADSNFAWALLWKQTADRIAGGQKYTHPQPIWFYLPFLPLFGAPWVLVPAAWRRLPSLCTGFRKDYSLRFLASWLVPTFIAFSLIGGKQPHYLMPLLPGLAIAMAWLLSCVSGLAIRCIATSLVAAVVALQLYAVRADLFQRFDLSPVAQFVANHPDRDWAYGRPYRGEISFLAGLQEPLDSPETGQLFAWFGAHPDGLAILKFERIEDISDCTTLFSMPYRGKQIGIFAAKRTEIMAAKSTPPGDKNFLTEKSYGRVDEP